MTYRCKRAGLIRLIWQPPPENALVRCQLLLTAVLYPYVVHAIPLRGRSVMYRAVLEQL